MSEGDRLGEGEGDVVLVETDIADDRIGGDTDDLKSTVVRKEGQQIVTRQY